VKVVFHEDLLLVATLLESYAGSPDNGLAGTFQHRSGIPSMSSVPKCDLEKNVLANPVRTISSIAEASSAAKR
jgi:hypothetical protein